MQFLDGHRCVVGRIMTVLFLFKCYSYSNNNIYITVVIIIVLFQLIIVQGTARLSVAAVIYGGSSVVVVSVCRSRKTHADCSTVLLILV